MTEIEMEYKRDQEEYIMQIAELQSTMSSQSHTEQVLQTDLEDARRQIARLITEAQHTSIESQQEGSTASENSNKSNNKFRFKTSSICSKKLSKLFHYLHSSNNKFRFKTSSICSIRLSKLSSLSTILQTTISTLPSPLQAHLQHFLLFSSLWPMALL